MRKILLALGLAALLPVNVFAWDRSYYGNDSQVNFNKVTSVEIYGWKSNIDGNLNVDGMVLDLDSEASFDDENRFGFRVSHVLSEKSVLQLSYMKNEHSGTINKAVTFDGNTYNVGASAKIENSWFDLTYAHNLGRSDSEDRNGKKLEAFYIDGLFGVKFSSAEVSVAGTSGLSYLEDSWSEDFPVPYIGVAAGGQLSENLWARGYLKYINVNAGGNDALHHDYGINLALKLNPNSQDTEWFVDLGYRGVKYDLDSDNDNAEISYSGPTLGVFARF
ncbi:MAG: hypothetical protein PWR01_2115 [Clostridiales bacterium]|jgi:hypothetical protein|nr:hypothetical protein [Clostridiales bacterium]MDN5281042.1 hypothetical protein [Candidatus Ozemobacter sp.]